MNKKIVLFLVLMLAVGFASVSTTLVLNGTLNIGFDSNFDTAIVFTKATTPYGRASIMATEKEISFETERLENVGQKSTLEYDVTNKSRGYDASVSISCGLSTEFDDHSKYVTITQDLTSPFTLSAGETKTGHLTVEMIKAYDEALNKEISFVCRLIATPVERDTVGDEYIPSTRYVDPVLNGADPVLTVSNNTRNIGKELIPVTIKESGEVQHADINSKWYDYENKEWANAVILVDNPSREYNVGNIIKESDIESYFVWVPRYKYQIFDEGNYTTRIDADLKNIAKEIKIEFESKDTPVSSGTTKDSWLTHPAFTNFDVQGLWIGKFETGYKGASSKEEAEVNASDSSKVIIKPNTYSWRNSTISNIFKTAYNYNREFDSHMILNTEWGAAAYLSHSKYGINTEIRINNNSDYLTGYAATDATDQSNYPGVSGTDETKTNAYNTKTGYKASSTGNITGIYDMSGGVHEYVAGYVESAKDASGFTTTDFTTYRKYFNVYPTDSSSLTFNKRILGDATGEMGPFYYYANTDGSKRNHSSWHGDHANFINSNTSWFIRGGFYGRGLHAGQFNFDRYTGAATDNAGSRLVLAPNI